MAVNAFGICHFTIVELESWYNQNAVEIAQHIVNNFYLQNPNSNFPFECLYETNGNKVHFFGPDGLIFRKADNFVKGIGFDSVVKSVNDTEIIWSKFKGKIDKMLLCMFIRASSRLTMLVILRHRCLLSIQ